ncbi:MAG: DUF2017 family protein [Demequinaceae bacterium]|nr:DUF2017 family protein [Demequinaceae bacterium]
MRGFQASPDGAEPAAVAELDSEERAVIARVVADVGLLLGGEPFGMEVETAAPDEDSLFRHLRGLETALSDPDDPAVLRVLPNAAPDDRDVADEFRRFTEPELRLLKVDRLRKIWSALSEDGLDWVVPDSEAMPTAAALTDVRLVLASRLGLESDDDATLLHAEIGRAHDSTTGRYAADTVDNPERVWLGMLYEALTWLQESLMSYVMRDDV